MSDVVGAYFEAREKLFEYLGYVQDWVSIPAEDQRGDYWMITGPEDDCQTAIVYSNEPLTEESVRAGAKIYSGRLYTQRFLPKWVYRGKKHTMISVDTRTDGNKILMIFDNDKECKDKALMDLYKECWSSF